MISNILGSDTNDSTSLLSISFSSEGVTRVYLKMGDVNQYVDVNKLGKTELVYAGIQFVIGIAMVAVSIMS